MAERSLRFFLSQIQSGDAALIQRIDRGLHHIYRFSGYLACGFVVLIGILVLINIGGRLLGEFTPGMTESAGYCMAAAGALGLAYTFGEHGHIRVTMLIHRLRGQARFSFELLSLIVAAGLACFMAFYLCRMVYVSYQFEERSDGSDELLIWLPQLPMALGFAVFAIALVHAVTSGFAKGEIEGPGKIAPDLDETVGH